MKVGLEKPAAAQPVAQLSEEVPRRAYTIPCLVHCRGASFARFNRVQSDSFTLNSNPRLRMNFGRARCDF